MQDAELLKKDKALEELVLRQSTPATRLGKQELQPQLHLISALKR